MQSTYLNYYHNTPLIIQQSVVNSIRVTINKLFHFRSRAKIILKKRGKSDDGYSTAEDIMMILFSIYLDHLPGALYTRKVVWASKRDHVLRAEQRGEQRRPTNKKTRGCQRHSIDHAPLV
jgi:hypothetical protein